MDEETKSPTLNDRPHHKPESGWNLSWVKEQNSPPGRPHPAQPSLAGGGCSGGQSTRWPAVSRLLRAKTKNQTALKQGFRQCRCQASPSYPKLTQVQGPESGAQCPRKPPAFSPSPWPPPDLHPCIVVSTAQAPSQRLPSAPRLPDSGLLSTFERRSTPQGGHGDRSAASRTATGSPPVQHACPHPGARRHHLPASPGSAGSRELGPARRAHVPSRPEPQCHSLTQTASGRSSHAGTTRAIPAAAAPSRLRSPLGLPRPQLRRVQPPPPLPNCSPPPSSRCHVCQSMRTTLGEPAREKCVLGVVVCSTAELSPLAR